MRVFLLSFLLLGLAGCHVIYKLPTRQGNVLEQKDLNKLTPGMTREQVKFVMGTAIATTPFRDDRWDYMGYYKSPRGEITQRTVSLYFDGNTLARVEGAEPKSDGTALSKPDAEAVIKADKADRAEATRATAENDPDVVLNPDEPRP